MSADDIRIAIVVLAVILTSFGGIGMLSYVDSEARKERLAIIMEANPQCVVVGN